MNPVQRIGAVEQEGTRRHERIAADLRAAIADGTLPPGALLPSEHELGGRYGAARSTVRQALQTLGAEGLIAARQGARRVVLEAAPTQTFSEFRSFAQWAGSVGHAPGGRFLVREWRAPEPETAIALQTAPSEVVLHTVRLRTLDGDPIFVERCDYAPHVADAVLELDENCPSVTTALRERLGIMIASGTNLIDLAEADDLDARLLGVPSGDPVLRRRGVTRDRNGAPLDYTEDRYRRGSVTFGFNSSTGVGGLTRTITPG